MRLNYRFIGTFVALVATSLLGATQAMSDESPTKRSSQRICEIRRAASLLNLGTLLKQGDYTGARFLLLGLPDAFADCQGVLKLGQAKPTERPENNTIASFSRRLIDKVLSDWSPDSAMTELDAARSKAQRRPEFDQRCAYRVVEVAKSLEAWHQSTSAMRVLQVSANQARTEQSRSSQKYIADRLWEAMARNDSAAKNYRAQVRACFSVCAPLEPVDCHPDAKQ